MVVGPIIKPVRSAGNHPSRQLSFFRQLVQVAIYRRPADGGVLFCNQIVNLVRSGVIFQFVDRVKHQSALYRISFHKVPLLIFIINKDYISFIKFCQ